MSFSVGDPKVVADDDPNCHLQTSSLVTSEGLSPCACLSVSFVCFSRSARVLFLPLQATGACCPVVWRGGKSPPQTTGPLAAGKLPLAGHIRKGGNPWWTSSNILPTYVGGFVPTLPG